VVVEFFKPNTSQGIDAEMKIRFVERNALRWRRAELAIELRNVVQTSIPLESDERTR
jgi:hypothetical protein